MRSVCSSHLLVHQKLRQAEEQKAEYNKKRLQELAEKKALEEQEKELRFQLEQEEARKREEAKVHVLAKRKLV